MCWRTFVGEAYAGCRGRWGWRHRDVVGRLFADNGWEVRVLDPRSDLPDIADRLASSSVKVTGDLARAANGADFVQKSGPERTDIKRQMSANHTRDDVVLASSSSLLPSVIAEGNPAANRIVIGHPFNPPEVMTLVEAVAGDQDLGRNRQPCGRHASRRGNTTDQAEQGDTPVCRQPVAEGVQRPSDAPCATGRDSAEGARRPGRGVAWFAAGDGGTVREHAPGWRPRQHPPHAPCAEMAFGIGSPHCAKLDFVINEVEHAHGTGAHNYRRRVEVRDA